MSFRISDSRTNEAIEPDRTNPGSSCSAGLRPSRFGRCSPTTDLFRLRFSVGVSFCFAARAALTCVGSIEDCDRYRAVCRRWAFLRFPVELWQKVESSFGRNVGGLLALESVLAWVCAGPALLFRPEPAGSFRSGSSSSRSARPPGLISSASREARTNRPIRSGQVK